jgi:hypothetical protein
LIGLGKYRIGPLALLKKTKNGIAHPMLNEMLHDFTFAWWTKCVVLKMENINFPVIREC